MAYIQVDHSRFESTAAAIDDYVRLLNEKMRSAQGEITALASSWQGSDFTQFQAEFDKVDNEDSVHMQMVRSLESYARYLRFAASQYKSAQARAVDRANSLPKW